MNRPGRKPTWSGPVRITSVRVPEDDWQWVKQQPGMEFSALLVSKIHELQSDKENGPLARFVREARKAGFSDAQIQPLLSGIRPSVVVENSSPTPS